MFLHNIENKRYSYIERKLFLTKISFDTIKKETERNRKKQKAEVKKKKRDKTKNKERNQKRERDKQNGKKTKATNAGKENEIVRKNTEKGKTQLLTLRNQI
jgi:FtsZ-interacting cell division protein YlmF